jgi:hypothetical protein
VVLDELAALLLDQDGAFPEFRVLVRLVLLLDRLDGLRFDPGLGRVVHTARKVAVSGGLQQWAAEFADARQQSHLASLTVNAPTWRTLLRAERRGRRR